MPLANGTYRLGPADGTLTVRTERTGAAAKAGHNLRIEVTEWEATLEVGRETSLQLIANGRSLRVREGTGGMQALDEADRANIEQTIDDEVLLRRDVVFRSTGATRTRSGIAVWGDLTLLGATAPIGFSLGVTDDGALSGVAVVRQSDWGMKPYAALFGALKVVDEVKVSIDARL